MGNIQKGEASFTTSESPPRTFHLVMDFNAFAEAEEVTGLAPQALLRAITPELDPVSGKVVRPPPLKVLGGLLYGALKDKHPDITHKDAINLLNEGVTVGEALGKVLDGVMPKADPSAEGKAPAPTSGTGTKPRKTGRRKA